jgi:hypothetical protein
LLQPFPVRIYGFSPHILALRFERKMKFAVFASLIASAAAFAPAATKAPATALNMAFEDELGAQPPLGFFGELELGRYLLRHLGRHVY